MKQNDRLKGLGVTVSSAGLSAMVGQQAHPISQELMAAKGIDISSHRARQLSTLLMHESDLVLVMEAWQQREIEKITPSARGKVFTIGRWQGFEVPDPYRKERGAFEEAFSLIEKALNDWGEKLCSSL